MYTTRIKFLEESIGVIDNKLDTVTAYITELKEQRSALSAELSSLRKKQYEYEHEYVDLSDDY